VLLIVILVIALTTAGPVGMGLAGSGLISFALMLAGWWLLYLRQPQPPVDMIDPQEAAGGIGATGYPGTVFPGGSPWAGPMYGPYTTLPDHYAPDPPKDAAAADVSANQPVDDAISQQSRAAGGPDRPASSAAGRQDAPIGSSAGAQDAVVDAPPGPQDALTDAMDAEKADAEETNSENMNTGRTTQPITVPPGPSPRTRTTTAATGIGLDTPGWDPLGVAPLAWDLPDPTTPPGPVMPALPRRPRSRLTPIVIGLAILAAAAAGALAASGVEWMTPGRIGAVALAVVGLGLIIGAFLRRGYGLMVVLAPLAGFVILASMAGPVEFDRGAVGDHAWTPTTMADLNPSYRVNMGDGTLDLRQLNLTADRRVDVRVRMGDFRVLVPESMRLETTCTARMGDVTCPPGRTGPATGPVLTLTIDVHAGDAEVKRG
jgi:hypothetical protein